MQKIVPHLWYDKEAKEAAQFYVSIFPNSKITNVSTIHDTPSGDCDIVSFQLKGYEFMAISAGPFFKLNPSISFMVNFDPSQEKDARENLDAAWEKLSEGGKVLMPLQEYPFSKRYGWIQDKYGLSWQLILTEPQGEERPSIIPSLLFANEVYGKVEEAITYYLSIFKDSKIGTMMKYGPNKKPDKEEAIAFADFMLEGIWFAAMDSALEHKFAFNEAVSFMIKCKDQQEIDYYWQLSHDPKSEQCGWLKDKYGVSWQVVPTDMDAYMKGPTDKVARVTQAFLKMKKFNLAELKTAYDGS